MKIISCKVSFFEVDQTIIDPRDRMLDYARSITAHLRAQINQLKPYLDESISHSAAFVALEQSLAELVHNSLDAFHLLGDKKNKFIMIAIPNKIIPNTPVTVMYCDNAGGFSNDFLKLHDHASPIVSAKKSSSIMLFGGQGFALSQICRFLNKHSGTLTLENTVRGAKLILSSPIKSEDEIKPSFHRFAVHIDPAEMLAEYEKQTEASSNNMIEHEPLSPDEVAEQKNENSGKKNKFGLRLQLS